GEGLATVEVLVVDNGSADGSAGAARRLGVTVLSAGKNLGYGSANNLGFEAARGRYYLVLNPDTIPCSGAIDTLVRFAERNPKAGIVAPRLLNPDGSVQRSAFRFPTLAMTFLDLFPPPSWLPGRMRLWIANSRLNGRYRDEPHRNRPFRCDHPLGAAMLVRREAVERCGGFDPGIFMYSEEIDLSLRFSRGGYSCWQVPAAEVVHLGGQSTAQMPARMFVELWRSRLYLYGKHRSPVAQLALRGLVTAAMLARIAVARIKRGRTDEMRAERQVLRLALGKVDV
ncbi:MAG TPA: glycosyltransferase family 2 protein, partial [Chloroflexia bacterium]|nr:glycosyltransferase family 2 protein [Chloroflexia bacterium]